MVEKGIIVALIVIAIWATMLWGMIFGKIRDWAVKYEDGKPDINRIPLWLQKPLFECPICMTPYYGTIAYWIIWGTSVKEWVIVVITAMGLVTWFVKTKKN